MKPKDNHLKSHNDRELQTWRWPLLFLRYNRLGDKGMIQLSRSIKKAWRVPGCKMQWTKLQNNPTCCHYSTQKRECLEVDGYLALTYLLFWHPNPGRVFPLGLPLRALDIFSEGKIKSDCDPKEPHTTVFGMIRESQSWVIFSIFTTTWHNFMKLVMIHHWDKTPDCLGKLPGPLLANFGPAGANVAQKTDSWKRKMSTFINFWLENVGISPMNSQQPFHGNPIVLELEPFVPGSVTRTMQFVMLVPRHSTMSVVAGKRWVMGVVKQHPMVRGPLENWEHGGWVPTFVVRILKTIQPLVFSELPNKI